MKLIEVWVSSEGKTVLPDSLVPHMVRHIHGQAHIGRDVMVRTFKHYWYNNKFRLAADKFCHRCVECQENNVGKRTSVLISHIGKSRGPFNRLQIDFVDMPKEQALKYIPVVVCIFSRWVEAYP